MWVWGLSKDSHKIFIYLTQKFVLVNLLTLVTIVQRRDTCKTRLLRRRIEPVCERGLWDPTSTGNDHIYESFNLTYVFLVKYTLFNTRRWCGIACLAG